MDTTLKRQYKDIKQKHPDCVLLFMVDSQYEAFEEDAIVVADILKLPLITATTVKIAGFPVTDIDSQLPKLIKAGHRVALVEQVTYEKR